MSPSSPHSQARFLPGAMVANRYRVVALLGRGGMGEVYRADDTKLGETVALKFLPERLENDASLRERFLAEARLARQVAHPHVCRVYDIGEIDGRLFLSMEYVDGEDLATLLRRIGRLPQDKAVQIAHEICGGLQAAHALGIVHRDLKPSNVMIDGRGRARIADFGLAALAETVGPGDAAAGTPAYMAPEQLLGQDATVRSDVYALGLVLYELFTGRAAFDARSYAEQIRAKQETTPSSPSRITPDLDPAIERVVMRCLLADPAQRPPSAAAVALALPGGDPLAAALAAGETPSPEMVADAGGKAEYPQAQAWGWLGAFVAALLVLFALAPSLFRTQQVPIAKPPAVLLDRAREIARGLGWTDPPRDEWSTLEYDSDYGDAMARRFGARDVVNRIRRYSGGTFRFFYRRSPRPLVPLNQLSRGPSSWDPPPTAPGMLGLWLDDTGRLLELEACPPQRDTTLAGREVDWAPLFALAGLDTAAFRRVPPVWTPPAYADSRMAWMGRAPGDTAVTMRVEAASCRGRPVQFRPFFAWNKPVPDRSPAVPLLGRIVPWVVWTIFLGLLVLASFVARGNLRAGRADARGALRMALAAGALNLAAAWFSTHFNGDANWLARRFLNSIGNASLLFLIASALYLTLEPVIRRTWPTMLISWVRLIDGRFRDARVGRDLLAGTALGAMLLLGMTGFVWGWARVTGAPMRTDLIDSPGTQTAALMGTGSAITVVLGALLNNLQAALTGAALVALFTALTHRRMTGLLLGGLMVFVIEGANTALDPISMAMIALIVGVGLAVMMRYGFLAMLACLTTMTVLSSLPLVPPGASWYWPTTAVGLVALFALALWGFQSMRTAPSPWAEGAPGASRAPYSAPPARPASAARPPSARPASPADAPTELSPPRPPGSPEPPH